MIKAFTLKDNQGMTLWLNFGDASKHTAIGNLPGCTVSIAKNNEKVVAMAIHFPKEYETKSESVVMQPNPYLDIFDKTEEISKT